MDSSLPNSANISKSGGELALPVRAARKGCATWPSLRPFSSAKARAAASSAGPLQSVASRAGRTAAKLTRPSGDSNLAAASSRLRGPSLNKNFRALGQLDQGLGALFQRRHGGLKPLPRGHGQDTRRGFARQKSDDFRHQAGTGGGADVMAVEIVQFLVIHPRGALADGFEIEPLDRLFGGNDLVIAMAPAQAEKVIAHGLGQVAHVAIGFDRQRAVALGKLGAVRSVDQGQVAIHRHGRTDGFDQLQLPRGIVEMVGTADHMGDIHIHIVHHHRQHIGGRAVRTQQHHIVQLAVLEAHIPQHDVMDDGFALLPRLQPHHKGFAVLFGARRSIAPAAVVAHRVAGGLLFLAHRRQFLRRRIATIGFAFGHQFFGHLAVTRGAGELVEHIAVPVQPHPGHAIEDGGHRFGGGALAVGVFDAQEKSAAGVAGIEPIEQSGAGATDMQHAGGRGRETQDGFF